MTKIAFQLRRELHFRVNGLERRGMLVIGGLRRREKTGDLDECWACEFSLAEIDPARHEVCGEDPLDALLNCIRFVLRLIQEHEGIGWRVWWSEEGDQGGLQSVFW